MSIFTEVFACFGDRESGLPDQVDCEVAQRCEGSCPCADAAAVLGEGDVADVVEAVLDTPVGAGKLEQTLWPGLLGREACDQIDDLDGLAAADLAAALEPGDLGQPRPFKIRHRLGRDGDPPGLDAAMLLLDRGGLKQIRRRTG